MSTCVTACGNLSLYSISDIYKLFQNTRRRKCAARKAEVEEKNKKNVKKKEGKSGEVRERARGRGGTGWCCEDDDGGTVVRR